MRKTITSFIAITLYFYIPAQTNWTQKQSFPGQERLLPASYTIGTKSYVTGGHILSSGSTTNEHWEYNALTNTWSMRLPVPGAGKWGAIAFAINGKGYFGSGNSGTPGFPAFSNDFFRYDPNTNFWEVQQSIGGEIRSQSTGFVINGKGYVALGYKTVTGERDKSVLQFDPTQGSGGSWTLMNDIPEAAANKLIVADHPAIQFTIDNRAYLTGGAVLSETWMYNPNNDSWTKKKNVALNAYTGFTIGKDGYAIGERFYNNQWEDVIMKYDKQSNTWSVLENLPTNMPASFARMFSASPCNVIGMAGTGNGKFFEYKAVQPTYGNEIVCNSSTYSLDLAPGATVSWTKSSNLNITGGQGTNSITVQANVNQGAAWVKPTISGGCGTVALNKYDFWIGKPQATTAAGPTICTNSLNQANPYILPVSPGAETYYISSNHPNLTAVSNGPGQEVTFLASNPGNYTATLSVSNSCGTSTALIYVTAINCGGGGGGFFTMFPNPATNQVSIEVSDEEFDLVSEGLEVVVKNEIGKILYSNSKIKKRTQLNTMNWKKGVYYVTINSSKGSQVERLIIE